MRLPRASLLFAPLLVLACSSEDPASSSTSTTSSTTTSGAGGGGGSPPAGDIAGAVTRYDLSFDLELAKATTTAHLDVATPGGDCLALDYQLGTVDSVAWNAAPAREAAIDGSTLRACGDPVTAGAPLALSAVATIPEETFLHLDVGFSRKEDLAGGSFSYLLSWVGGCSHFGPCDADPSTLAEHHVEVHHAPGTIALCPGALTAGDTVTRCDVEGTLAPTYSAFALAADPLWERAPFVSAAGVDVVFYEVPGGALAASLDADAVAEFLGWITDLLGPFPYGSELRVAGAPTRWLGFEHPANILLLEDLDQIDTSYADATMHVLMHEIVHQWAGDRTTLATAQDFVWKEATAEYLAYVFEDERLSVEDASATRVYWDSISLQSAHYPRPIDDPPPPVQSFYGDVYGPGPMVLYVQLEALIGRDAVLEGIVALLAEPGARSVDDLRVALEASSGADLGPYFDAWVRGAGKPEWPTFAVSTEQSGDQVTVTVTQQNASGVAYGCVVEVEVAGATESARALVSFGAAPSSSSASATVTLAEPALSTTLDPDHRVVGRAAQAASATAAPRLPVWIF
jgi:aminopeptidase N